MTENIYTGFHAVEEKIRKYTSQNKSDSKLKVYFAKPGPRIKKILAQAKTAGINCEETDEEYLDTLVARLPLQARDHRGIVLTATEEQQKARNDIQLEQWLSVCPKNATVVMLDGVTDPHNIGAILRSCDQFGANLLIVPERNSTSQIQNNETIARTSAGSSAWVPLAVVTNLVRAAQILKEAGFWIYGADAGGSSLQNTKFAQKSCIIMGSEGNGMTKLLARQCDSIVSIPTCGKIDSLNVSVAAGVLLYERHRQNLEQPSSDC